MMRVFEDGNLLQWDTMQFCFHNENNRSCSCLSDSVLGLSLSSPLDLLLRKAEVSLRTNPKIFPRSMQTHKAVSRNSGVTAEKYRLS